MFKVIGFISTVVLLTSCNDTLTPSSLANKPASFGTGSIAIQSGMKVTADPVLKLDLQAPPGNFTAMKLSTKSDCSDGIWEEYFPETQIVTPTVNGQAYIYVQFRDSNGNVTACIGESIVHENPNTPKACETNPTVCDRSPQVVQNGVVTVLLALGDKLNQQMIVNGSSAAVIAETAIRFASPIEDPSILVVRDRNNQSESYQDTEYIANNLLALYSSVTLIDEPVGGLKDSDVSHYDLVWLNNPGYPMGMQATRDTLLRFRGGIVLSGDDMTWGNGFSTEALTGLRHIDNGTSVVCNGISYPHDNNYGYQYSVSLDPAKLPGFPANIMDFKYGNDIDNSMVASANTEVISWAVGGGAGCTAKRPVIARYKR